MKAYSSFQNSLKGIVVLYQNFNKGNLTLQFAIATNPKKPNEIQKGDKIYDYQNGKWFALSEDEANMILDWFQNQQTPTIEIKHYPEGKMTVLTVGKGEHGYFISYSEIQNKQQTFNLGLGLSPAQVRTFINFLMTFPMVKTLSAYHDFVAWKKNSNNGNQTSNNQQSFPTNTQPQQTVQQPVNQPTQTVTPQNPLSFIRR